MQEDQNIPVGSPPLLSWSAPEYIYHQKQPVWYSAFIVVSAAVGCLLWLIIRDIWSLIVLVMMMIAVVVFSLRKPRVLKYNIYNDGLDIDGKFFAIDKFRAFSEIQEHGYSGVMLLPVGRVSPPITMYVSEGADQLAAFFEQKLVKEAHQPDMVDRLMSYIRF